MSSKVNKYFKQLVKISHMNIDFSKIQFGIAQLSLKYTFLILPLNVHHKILWDHNIYFMRINIREFGMVIYPRINVPMNVCQN